MSSDRCECGFYNRDRHHTKIGGGECDFIAYRKRIAELEQKLTELREAAQEAVDIEFDDILDEGHEEAIRKLRMALLGGGG